MNHVKRRGYLLATVLLAGFVSCHQITAGNSINTYSEATKMSYQNTYNEAKIKRTIPARFEHIKLNKKARSDCSPKLDEDYLGIVIDAPSKVIIDDEYFLPVCASWQFTFKFSNRFEYIDNEMVIVAVDSKARRSYSTNLLKRGFVSPETTKYEGTDEELEENIEGGWFNIDLFRYIEELPREPATYTIFATIGDVKSNVVEVELVESE